MYSIVMMLLRIFFGILLLLWLSIVLLVIRWLMLCMNSSEWLCSDSVLLVGVVYL